MSINSTICPTCKIPEPLFDLETARMLIPMVSVNALRVFLSKHKEEFPPRYRRSTAYYRSMKRLLTASEIERIRSYYVIEREYRLKGNRGTQGRDSNNATA